MADKRFVGDQDQLSEIDRTRVDRILVDGDASRNVEANRLIYPGPGSLVLTPGDLPDKIERQQRVQDIEATGKLSDAELRVLVASQKAMAAQVPALLRSHGAESAWSAKVEALLRLTRSRTTATRIVRLSATTPDKPPPSVVVEGELCHAQEAAQDGDQTVSAERTRTFDEGIDYDKRIVVQLDQAADDGNPRLWLSAPVCLVVSSEEGVPVRVETEGGSEYLILVL